MKASRLLIFLCTVAIALGFNGPIATAAFVVEEVTWTAVVNARATANSLERTSRCIPKCTSGGISKQEIFSGDGYMEFTATGPQRLYVGLSHGSTNSGFSEIDFAISLQKRKARVWEKEVYKKASLSFVPGDVFRIAIVSGVVEYSKNGTVFYRSETAYAINDNGQIVGTGLLNGVQRAFLLDPIPPSNVLVASR